MDSNKKKEMHELLLDMKKNKLSEIRQNNADMESVDNFKNDAGDFADTATNIYEKDLHFDLTENNKQMLIDIEEALAKIDSGTYGK